MKKPKNSGKQWHTDDVKRLKKLANGNTPTRLIAYELGRTPGAVQQRASHEGISLKPVNQSPYNRRKT